MKNAVILWALLVCAWIRTPAQQVQLSEVADRAVLQSKLTTHGSSPFRLKSRIAEKDSPDSDYKADVEVLWVSAKRWRRTIRSPDFSQTLIVNGDKVFEQDTGEYYPFWLSQLVTAATDPLPMLESLKRTNADVLKPRGLDHSSFCARIESNMGIPPVVNTAYSVFCFREKSRLIDHVTTPDYAVEFKNYESFKDKQVARLLVTHPEPGTTIEARITELSELRGLDESLFFISQETPEDKRLQSVLLSETTLRGLLLGNPQIVWPPVKAGKASGVLSIYVCIDKTGHVRETRSLNSDNADMSASAIQQVQEWRFKAATVNGKAVQVASFLTFAFHTRLENPVPLLSDAEARNLADNTVDPQIPPGSAPTGTSFTVRVALGLDGKLLGVENTNDTPKALFEAAHDALKEWHFRPYVSNGKPDFCKADITFQVH